MSRLLSLAQARGERATLRHSGKRLVLTNGCFDLLHVGHLRYLQAAAELGDQLWVGINTDRSARLLKGPGRPLVPWEERAELVAALEIVDATIGFNEITAAHLLTTLRPDVYVKGGDYTPETLPETSVVRALDIELHLIPPVPARSTSDLVALIVARSRTAALTV